jgi:hypothetical protein
MKDSMMNYRMFTTVALALIVALFASAPAWAAKDTSAHYGSFVSASDGQFVMKNGKGQQMTHSLAPNAKVTCDGKACKLADLKAATKLRVTTKYDDPKAVTNVEAIDKLENFANTHDGKFVGLVDNKLVMSDAKGKQHSHKLADDATLTCDGLECNATNLKAGMKIRVTTGPDDNSVVTHVCAIDKDSDF